MKSNEVIKTDSNMNDQLKQHWAFYKEAWTQGHATSLAPEDFDTLFDDPSIADDAIELLRTSAFSRTYILHMALHATSRSLENSNRRRVWLAVQGENEDDDLFAAQRASLSVTNRCDFIGEMVRGLIDLRGRKWVRQKARRWWASSDLLEEEREAIVRILIEKGVTDIGFFTGLGPSAEKIALEILRSRGVLPAFGQHRFSLARQPTSSMSQFTAGRVESLLAPVSLATDIRDACLEEDELSRLQSRTMWPGCNSSLFTKALSRAIRRFPEPILDDLARELSRLPQSLQPGVIGPQVDWWRMPLLRLLHLQQLLEAPSLSRSLQTPEVAILPAAAMYLMGRDAVSYTPELRMHRGVGRRWRARWVESAAEAFTCAFLEDALKLNLRTLARIPERANQPTPDFMATTKARERIVFESKGGTAWRSHLQQRKQAVRQLAKTGGGSSTSWAGTGRAFACSLFAAQQGDERSSLLHVDDPVFSFDDLFHEGWESACMRNHYAAVLESAQMFDLADFVARGQRPPPIEDVIGTAQSFEISESDQIGDSHVFIGKYLPLTDWIRRLRHPEPDTLRNLRLFVGVEKRIYSILSRGELPAIGGTRPPQDSSEGEGSLEAYTGTLSSGKSEGMKRGAYSVLSDGAFLAVEFE